MPLLLLSQTLVSTLRGLRRAKKLWSFAASAGWLLLAAAPLNAQSITWVGNTSGNFSDGTNWDTGLAPNSTTNTVIDTTTVPGNWPTVSVTNAQTQQIIIGDTAGSSANTLLTIQSGKTLASSGMGTIGNQAGSAGNVSVDGVNSLWSLGGSLIVGSSGNGTLTIANGGNVSATSVSVGTNSGSTGRVFLDSSGVLHAGNIVAGSGAATLTFNGGILQAAGNSTDFISNFGSGQVVLIGDGGSIDSNGFNITMNASFSGNRGLTKIGAGTMTVNGSNSTYTGATTVSAGTLVVTSSSAVIDGTAGTLVGSSVGANLTVSNGANLSVSGLSIVGVNAGETGNVLVTGNNSLWSMHAGGLTVGGGGNGTLTIADGATVVVSDGLSLAYDNTSTGSILVSGVAGSRGVLESYDVEIGDGDGTFTLDGGIVRARVTLADYFIGFTSVELGGGGGFFDSNGHDMTIAAVLESTGGLTKLGAGSLTLSAVNTYAGNTTIAEGALIISADDNLGAGSTLIFDGGTLFTTANITSGRAVTLDSTGVFSPGGGTTLILNGDLSGNAGLTTSGSGNLTLTGNNTYAGDTNVTGGTLAISGGNLYSPDGDLYIGAPTAHMTITNGAVVIVAEVEMANGFAHTDTLLVSDANTALLIGGELVVGNLGHATLTIANGGNVAVTGPAIFGEGSTGVGNATITDTNSTLSAEDLFIGINGTASVTIANGATTQAGNVTLGVNSTGNGALLITDAGSSLAVDAMLTVGNLGTGNLTLANGATMTNADTNVGTELNSHGSATVTGANSTWIASGGLGLGVFGNGTLTISDGGNVSTGVAFIGQTETGVGNVTVTDAGSSWNAAGMSLGGAGQGTLTVSNGGFLGTTGGSLGGAEFASGSATVTGAGSRWDSSAALVIVGSSGNGSITISNGGNLTAGDVTLGNTETGIGLVTVTGVNSTLEGFSGNVIIGNLGLGNLTVLDGALVNSGNTSLGVASSGRGESLVTDGAMWNMLEPDGLFIIDHTFTLGDAGIGILTISNGGMVSSGTAILGNLSTGNGTLVVTGNGSIWDVEFDQLVIGTGGNGSVSVLDGAHAIAAGTDGNGISAYLGADVGSSGMVLVSGEGSIWNVGTDSGFGGLMVGGYGTGNLTIANGGFVSIIAGDFENDAGLYVGYDSPSATATITGANSTLLIPDDGFTSIIGYNGPGLMTITDGGLFETHGYDCPCNGVAIYLGYLADGNGTLIVTGANATLLVPDGYYGVRIGEHGTGNLAISNGGNGTVLGLDDEFAMEIGYHHGSNGTVTVTDEGSRLLFGEAGLAIGYNGTGSLTIANGGNVTGGAIVMGFDEGGVGELLVTGANSTLTLVDSDLFIGAAGAGNVVISDGAHVTNVDGHVGGVNFEDLHGTGCVTVTGANSTWTNEGVLFVGSDGDGTLTIANGGLVFSSDADGSGNGGYVGFGGNATLFVTDPGSTLNITSRLWVGWVASGNLTIANGGVVTNGDAANVENGSSATITGAGSRWLVNGPMSVGTFGTGNLTISNGGNLSTSGSGLSDVIGGGTGTVGNVVVTGTGSVWNSGTDFLQVGDDGTGTLTIENGGSLLNSGLVTVGYGMNGTGMLNISNATVNLGAHPLFLGDSGNGTLNLTNGGNLTSDDGSEIGLSENSTGMVIITGTGSLWTVNGSLIVGGSGNATALISDGGNLVTGLSYVAYSNTSTANITVTGGNAVWNNDYLTLGYNGTASLTISNGGAVIGMNTVTLGDSSMGNGTVMVTGNGSIWNSTDSVFFIGYDGEGSVTVANGAALFTDCSFFGVNSTGKGSVLITGTGSIWYACSMSIGSAGNGTLTIANGAFVFSDDDAVVGDQSTGNGTVAVMDAGSLWDLDGYTLYVGYDGQGSVTITNGGNVSTGAGRLGVDAGSNGTVIVAGAGSQWHLQSLDVGVSGNAALIIVNGGAVYGASDAIIGRFEPGNGTVVVSEAGARWDLGSNALYIGDEGLGNLVIADSGNVVAGYVEFATGNTGFGEASVKGANSTWSMGQLTLGHNGTASLTISNGGQATGTADAFFGYLANGHGTMEVADIGSHWDIATYALYVGYSGYGNLIVSHGGSIITDTTYIGNNVGSIGGVFVTGANSFWDACTLVVGFAGVGSLVINDGGNVTHDIDLGVTVGDLATGQGIVMVADSGSRWDLGGNTLTIGNYGIGDLTISNGGHVSSGDTVVAAAADSDGSVLVTDAVSQMSMSSLSLGQSGNGSLIIGNGGNVVVLNDLWVGKLAGANGTAIVDGAGSRLSMGPLTVAMNGTGSLSIANGGNVSAAGASIGHFAGSNGTINVNGIGSTLSISNSLNVGRGGNGTINIINGGNVSAGNFMYVGGENPGLGNGIVNVDGTGSRLTVATGYVLTVGYHGTGTLNVTNGGNVTAQYVAVAGWAGNTGAVLVDGAGSRLLTSDDLIIGYAGNGTLTISNGGIAASGIGTVGGPMSSSGTALVTGADSTWGVSSLSVGINSTASLIIANGGNVTGSAGASLGYSSNGNATVLVTGTGSLWNLGNNILEIGNVGVGNLVVANGGLVSSGNIVSGIVIGGSGIIQLNGTAGFRGTLLTSQVSRGNGTGSLTFNGGILMASANNSTFVSNFTAGNLVINSGGAYIDTNGFDVGMNQALSGNGALNKEGAGRLTLFAASTYSGGTVINAGTLVAGHNSALGIGNLAIHNGARLSLASVDPFLGAVTITNGTLTGTGMLTGTAFSVDTGSTAATTDLVSSGSLTKAGAGNFTLGGNGTFAGGTFINSGALVVDGDIATGNVTASGPAAILAGNGTVPDVVINNGAAISPGYTNTISGNLVSNFSTLTVTGNLAWNGTGSVNPWHLNTGNLTVTGFASNTSDLLVILGTLANAGDSSPIIFDFQNTGAYDVDIANHTYTLITAADSFLSAGFLLSQFHAIDVGYNGLLTPLSYFQFADGGTSLQFVVVPEPATWALLLGGVVLLMAWRRRRQ